jgi:hypothetical protein
VATPQQAQADALLRRMERRATLLSPGEDWTVCPYDQTTRDGKPMRWKLSSRWIEFECGCAAERFRELVDVQRYDPVIFMGLPEQALYTKVCEFHQPGVYRARLSYGGFKDFDQWYRARYRRLTMKAGAR